MRASNSHHSPSKSATASAKGPAVRPLVDPTLGITATLLQPGVKVWVPNPYDDSATSSKYRSLWLPAKVCGRPVWVPGSISSVKGIKSTHYASISPDELRSIELDVITELEPQVKLKLSADRVQIVNSMTPMETNDLCDIADVNEASVVTSILARFLADAVYTKVGPCLVAVNPNRVIMDRAGDAIYDPIYMYRYKDRMSTKLLHSLPPSKRAKLRLPPHAFEVADAAISDVTSELLPQSIIVTGESGAGKTEVAKMVLGYIAATSADASRPSHGKRVFNATRDRSRQGPIGHASNPLHTQHLLKTEAQLVLCDAIVDAFGCCRTLQNANSSRFVKVIKVLVDREGSMVACAEMLLMGTEPLLQQALGERSFSALYYMLAGAPDEIRTQLSLLDVKLYPYLVSEAKTGDVIGAGDAAEFANLTSMLAQVGFSEDVQGTIWRMLAAVLTLGNVRFDGTEGIRVSNLATVEVVAALFGVSVDALCDALVTTTAIVPDAGGPRLKRVSHTVESAQKARDDTARWLYRCVFQWVVDQCNRIGSRFGDEAIASALQSHDALTVTLVDSPGFENTAINSLEQFCANYAYEKLEQLFCTVVFKREIEMYRSEGIAFTELAIHFNDDVMELLENPVNGITMQLQEVCLFPRPNDRTLVSKLNSTHAKKNPAFGQAEKRVEANHFVVFHAPGAVSYCVDGFVAKNKEWPPSPFVELLETSNWPALRGVCPQPLELTPSSFTLAAHRHELGKVMDDLKSTHSHFIRCLRPNASRQPSFIEPEDISRQLAHSKVMDIIRVSRAGFAFQATYADFVARFAITAPSGSGFVIPDFRAADVDYKALANQLIQSVAANDVFQGVDVESGVQFGTTKIFLKSEVSRAIEASREMMLAMLDRLAVRVQAVARGKLVRKHLKAMLEGFAVLQAAWRTKVAREQWLLRNQASVRIQTATRTWLSNKWFKTYVGAIQRVQRWARSRARVRVWRRLRSGIRAFHMLARGYIVRVHVANVLASASLLQRVIRRFLARNKQRILQTGAARKMQSVWKGFRFRVLNEDMMDWLALRRMDRTRDQAARKFQALWKSVLIWRRFRQVRSAAITLQRLFLMKLHHTRFQRQTAAVRKIQSVARGYISREQVRRLRTLQSIADELWRLQKVRQREYNELCHANSDTLAARRSHAAFTAPSRRTTIPEFRAIDVDVIMDNSDVFPRGFMQSFAELQGELYALNTRCVAVCPGAAHCIVLAENGHVFSWGWGDRGQCGHGVCAGERKPRLIEALLESNLASDRFGEHAEGFGLSRGPVVPTRIRSICTGEEHTLAMTDHGTVYSWGDGKRGQLGHGDVSCQATPKVVDALKRKVAAVAAGSFHSVFLLAAGSVYVCGSGRQLGLGVFTGNGDQAAPQPVKALSKKRVKAVAAASGFTLALTGEGDLYSWGTNKDGQLGLGDTKDRLVPFCVSAFHADPKHCRVAAMSCGNRHAGAITTSGRVYTWGDASYGQLGLDDNHPRLLPSHVVALINRRVTQIACSARSTLIATDSNEIVSWGMTTSVAADAASAIAASEGRTEPGEIDVFFQTSSPLEVPFHSLPGRTVKKLVAGFSHTMAITGVQYVQAAVDAHGDLVQAQLNVRTTATTRSPTKLGELAKQDPTRRALAKMQPLIPALPAGSSGVEAKAPDVGEEKEDDSLGAFLRGRTQSRSSAPVVTMATSRPSGSKHTPVLPTSPLALLTALPRGAVLPSRSPQLSGAAQKALMMLPPERLKHLTAEQLRVLARDVETSNSLSPPPPPPGGSAVSKTSSALVASPPGKSSASGAVPARAAADAAKALKIAQAKAARLLEEDERREWRVNRERVGKSADSVDVGALFSLRAILASNSDDTLDGKVVGLTEEKRAVALPASESKASSSPTRKGLTVRDLLLSGAALMQPKAVQPPPPPPLPFSSAPVSVRQAVSETAVTPARPSAVGDHVPHVTRVGVSESLTPQPARSSESKEADTLETVLASIKRRAAAQVDALWYKSAAKTLGQQ